MVLVQDIPVQRSQPWPIGQYKPTSTLSPVNAPPSCWPRETASSDNSRASCFDRLMQHVNDCIEKDEEEEAEDDDLDIINLPKIQCYRYTSKGILVHPSKYSTVPCESISNGSVSTFASSSNSSLSTRRDSDNSMYSSSSSTTTTCRRTPSVRFTSEPPRIHCTPPPFSFLESSPSSSSSTGVPCSTYCPQQQQ
ncbi:hypothetical protein K492DRAFT_196229 [Lichtheimia hyalospora FSU 10163]|nr:hypothetical protein K492DRAFT_196229 [Lichtheimia hyalospora FSU 10163]